MVRMGLLGTNIFLEWDGGRLFTITQPFVDEFSKNKYLMILWNEFELLVKIFENCITQYFIKIWPKSEIN